MICSGLNRFLTIISPLPNGFYEFNIWTTFRGSGHLDKLLSGMADKLGDSSKTERAIRNKEPLAQIAQQAKEEGLNDFFDILKLSIDAK